MEKEGLRRSDRVIVEELHEAILDSIFNPTIPRMRKGMTKEEIADLVAPWNPKLPWPDSDTRVMRLKEMYGHNISNILEGADVSGPDHGGPSAGFQGSILKRIDELYQRFK